MTTKRFPIYINVINLIMLLIVIVSADMFFCVAGLGGAVQLYEFIGYVLIILITYLARELINRLWVYIPVHVLMFYLCTLPSVDLWSKAKVLIVAFLFCIIDAHYWLNGRDGEYDLQVGFVAVTVVAYIYSVSKNSYLSDMLYVMAIAFVCLDQFKKLLINYHDLALSGQLTSDMPVTELFRNNFIGAFLVTFAMMMAMVLIKAESLIAYINEKWMIIAAKIGAYMRAHLKIEHGTYKDPEITDAVPPVKPREELFTEFFKVVEVLLIIFLTLLVLYLTIRGLKELFKYIGEINHIEKKQRRYKNFETDNEVREKIVLKDSKKSGFSLFKTPEEKIRYMYRKKLLSLMKSGSEISENQTPRENGEAALKNYKDITRATWAYEKVRYIPDYVVTKEEVAVFKELIK